MGVTVFVPSLCPPVGLRSFVTESDLRAQLYTRKRKFTPGGVGPRGASWAATSLTEAASSFRFPVTEADVKVRRTEYGFFPSIRPRRFFPHLVHISVSFCVTIGYVAQDTARKLVKGVPTFEEHIKVRWGG